MYLRSRLGVVMKEKGVSEAQLNTLTGDANGKGGVSRNTIRALSRNASTRIDFDTVNRLARALGVKPTDLFESTETAPGNRPATRRSKVSAFAV